MGDNKDSKNQTVKQIFKTMVYGDDEENITEAIEWLKARDNRIFAYIDKSTEAPNGEVFKLKNACNDEDLCDIYIPEAVTIENILKNVTGRKNKWLEVPILKRVELIQNLCLEIKKKENLFVQIELTARGILSKDTKNKLTLLTDYLQFYSSFAIKYNTENTSWKPEGVAAGIISNKNCISVLGYILGPCLALGYNVILQISPELSIFTTLLIEIATELGIPEGTIRLIPDNKEPTIFFTCPEISIISIFDDLHKEKYFINNFFDKKFLNFYSSGIPMLVFDNCDLDSAVYSLINSAWGYRGLLPWSVRTVLVQENIFEHFLQKLKIKIDKVLVSRNKKNVDISSPDSKDLEKLKQIVEKAKNEGVEIYHQDYPTLLIGGKVFPNNVIKEDSLDVPLVTVTAFRTINEAVALANNTRQGLAASVWSESTSLIHEVIKKLKAGNVWINSHGQFSPEITISPYKSSGNGYFGGSKGLKEYISSSNTDIEAFDQILNGDTMEKAIGEAKKAQESWWKLSKFERVKCLQNMAQNIATKKASWKLPEEWLEDWIFSIYDYAASSNVTRNNCALQKKFNVVSIKEPFGVVAIETLKEITSHNKKLIIAALVEGNSVIIMNNSEEASSFYSSSFSLLPKGVLTVVTFSQSAIKVAALHKELIIYFGEKNNTVFRSLPLKSFSKFKKISSDSLNQVTLTKNIWFNIGQSFL